MTKKLIKQLVTLSYDDNKLNQIKVDNIAHLLNRKELREYVKALKAKEKELTVELVLPNDMNESDYVKKFQSLFSGKKIHVTQDANLLLGVRITDNDIVYDLSLQNRMKQVKQYIEENF